MVLSRSVRSLDCTSGSTSTRAFGKSVRRSADFDKEFIFLFLGLCFFSRAGGLACFFSGFLCFLKKTQTTSFFLYILDLYKVASWTGGGGRFAIDILARWCLRRPPGLDAEIEQFEEVLLPAILPFDVDLFNTGFGKTAACNPTL